MTDCIYTGAYIHITNYDAYAPADIFRCGESIVLRINGEHGWKYGKPILEVTHHVYLPKRERDFFWPSDTRQTFTAVIPVDCIFRTEHARKPDLPEIS